MIGQVDIATAQDGNDRPACPDLTGQQCRDSDRAGSFDDLTFLIIAMTDAGCGDCQLFLTNFTPPAVR